MAVERYGSKTDVVVKLILVFFISLLSFSIGTFVGKKFSDNQHKLAQLEPGSSAHNEEQNREVASDTKSEARTPATAETKNESLSDTEIAKLAEEFVTEDENPVRKISSEETAEKKDEHATTKEEHKTERKAEHKTETASTPHDKVAAVAHAVATGQEEKEPKKEEKKSGPATALPKEVAASATGKFTVQVASYPKEEEAQGMATELKNKGFSAFYVQADIKGHTWYRVSVGLFTTQKEAQAYREDLLARAKVSSAIVQKITK